MSSPHSSPNISPSFIWPLVFSLTLEPLLLIRLCLIYFLINIFTSTPTPPYAVFKDVDIGNLKVNTKYRVTVGAYGWAGEGRPSMPRDIGTASHGKNMWVVGIHSTAVIANAALVTSLTELHFFFCSARQVHAPVAPHSACGHGCIWHRAGVVMATRRERGKCTCPPLPGGLHQVSLVINPQTLVIEAECSWNATSSVLLQTLTQAYVHRSFALNYTKVTRANAINPARGDTQRVGSGFKGPLHRGRE